MEENRREWCHCLSTHRLSTYMIWWISYAHSCIIKKCSCCIDCLTQQQTLSSPHYSVSLNTQMFFWRWLWISRKQYFLCRLMFQLSFFVQPSVYSVCRGDGGDCLLSVCVLCNWWGDRSADECVFHLHCDLSGVCLQWSICIYVCMKCSSAAEPVFLSLGRVSLYILISSAFFSDCFPF